MWGQITVRETWAKSGEEKAKAVFPRKTKSRPRKEINHSTLCALSENSVYIVLMLNMDLTKTEVWVCWRNMGQRLCVFEAWVERASAAIITLQTRNAGLPSVQEWALTHAASTTILRSVWYYSFTAEEAEAQRWSTLPKFTDKNWQSQDFNPGKLVLKPVL